MSGDAVTEDRVRVIVNECLATYEAIIGTVRHKENKEALEKSNATLAGIKTTVDQLHGSWGAMKVMGTVIGFLLMLILALLTYFATQRSHQSLISHHEPALNASAPFNSGVE